jgi:GxxExxY protein
MIEKPRTESTEQAEVRAPGAMSDNQITDQIIGAAIEVHRHLGPGLLESVYEACLCYELSLLGLQFERQVHLPIHYKGIHLEAAYKVDLIVADAVVVEIKATEDTARIHAAQLLTYLKSSGKRVGLLINFNVPILKNGLKRIVNRYTGPAITPRISAPSALASPDDATAGPLLSTPRLSPRLRVSASNSRVSASRRDR